MRKLNAIQYVRALAAVLVVVLHISVNIAPTFSPAALRLASVGAAGVDLFFVVSGFIMWTIAEGRPLGAGEFMLRRLTRIVPLYWLTTLAWTALALVGILDWIKLTPETLLKSLLFIPHFSATFPDRIYPVLIPGWTLNYEMFFYLIFACCLLLPARIRLGGLVTTLSALVVAGGFADTLNPLMITFTSPQLTEFLAGVLIGHFWRRGQTPRCAASQSCVVAGVALLVASGMAGLGGEAGRALFWGAPCALIVLGALGSPTLAKAVPPLVLVGDASYSIYLTHFFALTGVEMIRSRLSYLPELLPEIGAYVAVNLVLCLVLGILAFRLCEQPMERFFRTRLLTRGSATLAGQILVGAYDPTGNELIDIIGL